MAGCVLWALCSEWHLLLAVFVVSPLTYGLALFALGVVGRPDVDLFFQMFNRKKLKVPNEHLIR
ncbi:MAG TPA: hypothetical protein PK152_21300, partial [Anaerolineales bacterium]|nr:hypothetical protein [Anaerolineales bacterium]